MATTTPNFGWTVPTSTDLVKDGATAIETLGDGIDASFVDLKGGTTGQVLSKASGTDLDFTWVAQDDSNAIQNAIVDAKGDLIAATAADTPARLAVGTNGQVLTADSTAATGIKWATAASGGMTELASGTFSNNSLSLSSISGSYKSLQLWLVDIAQNNDDPYLRFNSDTGSNYAWCQISTTDSSVNRTSSSTAMQLCYPYLHSGYADNTFIVTLDNYANTTSRKPMTCVLGGNLNNTKDAVWTFGVWANTNAITSISSQPMVSGSYILYGVNQNENPRT